MNSITSFIMRRVLKPKGLNNMSVIYFNELYKPNLLKSVPNQNKGPRYQIYRGSKFKPSYFYKDTWELKFKFHLKSASYFNLLPVSCQPQKTVNTVLRPLSSYRLIFHTCLVSLYLLDIIYMAVKSRQVTMKNTSDKEFIHFYLHFITRSVAGIIALLVLLNEICSFWNFFIYNRNKKYQIGVPVD